MVIAMRCIVFYIISVFFVTSIDSRVVFDIYHDSTRHSDGFSENIQTPNQTYDDVGLFKFLNAEYYGLIKVGKPAKEFKVIFDTAWADSWLASEECPLYEIPCLLHTRYDNKKSSTYQKNGAKFSVSNDALSLSGHLSADDFYLPHLKVKNQTFIEMTHMSYNPFAYQKADGVIGLGFSSLAVNGTLPFFYNMLRQKIINESIFTFYMNRDPTTEKAGRLILGGTERSHIRTNLTYLPVRDKKYWTIQMDKIIVGANNQTSTFCKDTCDAMIDTSSNPIYGPADVIDEINTLLGAKAVSRLWPYKYVVDCRTVSKLPHVTFVLNGQNFTIESKYYIQRMTFFSLSVCVSPFVPSVSKTISEWQLGGAFLMQYYAEFDLSKGRIGIAETIV